jgi:DNA/RNA endonuclease YhcR with UshA esterase domain/uncharacterized protein YdeI (BOF family)/methionine-rich copper-binding protein CopC
MTAKFRVLNVFLAISMALSLVFTASQPAFANSTAQTLPFSQNWANTSLITVNDDWSSVPGVIGYIGDYLPTSSPTGIDPQTILDDITTTVDVIANNTNPSGSTAGGVIEAEIADAVIALQGSGTADAPYILINLDTTAKSNILVAYNVRDIDGSIDNAIQPVALHYRVGNSGSWTNVAGAFITDATTGPSLATLVTPVSVTLPSNANNQSLVQIRVITSNAVGSDEWVGIDDITVTGTDLDVAPTVISTVPTTGATGVAIDATLTVNFSEPVTASGTWATLTCDSNPVAVTLGGSGSTYTIDPDADLSYGASCTATVLAAQVTDLDGTPDPMAADYGWSFSTAADLPPTVSSTVPTDSATGVSIDSTITVNFSEPVTATGTWGTLTCDSLPVAVTLGGSGSVYTIDPDADLPNAVSCTTTVVAAQVTDLDGTADPMTSDYSWSFNTEAADLAPTVVSTIPDTGAINVAIDSNVTITFSEPITAPTGILFIVCDTSGVHNFGTLTGTGTPVIDFDPEFDFTRGETCTATIDHTKVYDEDGTPTPMDADYSWSFTILPPDAAPSVSTVTPVNGATGVAYASNLTVTFSEPVDVADGWYAISCATSGTHTALVTDGPTSFTLNPDTDFVSLEVCTVTLESTLITDQDTDEPPDNMAADFSWSFTTLYDPDTILPIATARANVDWTVTIQGNLTIDPHLLTTRDSFYIQDGTGGMYIYPAFDYVAPVMDLGDVVTVKGTVKVYNGITELDPVTSVVVEGPGTVPTPTVTVTNPTVLAGTQGKLIQVEGTIRTPNTPPAPGAAHYTLYINDGSGEVTVYVYKLTNIDMRAFTNGKFMRIIGISTAYGSSPQIQPRYQYDINDLTPPTVTGTDPLPDASGVSPHRPISATFSKAMAPGSFTGNFTIAGVTGTVSYDDVTHTATFTPDAALAASTLYTATINISVTDSYGVALASPYSWSFTTGDLDTTSPSITDRSPVPDTMDVPVSAEISVTFDEELAVSSLDLNHFVLTGPYGVVPTVFDYDPVSFIVTLTPSDSLLYSSVYTMTVTADTADYAGNSLGADDTWTFTTMAEPPMQAYFGDLHNHTSISDGSGTPAQALAAGEAAGFDFMAISDHSYAIDDSEWATTLSAVEAATDADFVALRGFEYTQGAEGHINVWNSTRHAVRTNTGCTYCDYTPNLEAGSTVSGFYAWLASPSNVGLDGSGTLMQFNHPGWINFNDWFYHPEVSDWARLEEIGNGNGSSYVFSEEQFNRSLDYGWKIGATNNADTHTDQWGTNTENRTGVIMPDLTKSALLEAMRLRRTFATEDMNFSLTMKANDMWMGSEIPNTGTIEFVITGQDADGELAALVELITDQGELAAYATPYSDNFTWEPELTITPGVHYFYVKVTQNDGDRIVSSPIWTMGSEDIAVTDLAIQPTIPTTHNASLITARVTNRIVTENRVVHVILKVDDVQQGLAVEVTVPANGDGYANFSWQPTATGDVTITAEITDAPVGDNPDDNSASLYLDVTDELLPLILIDAGHGNVNATGNDMAPFINDLSAHGYNVLKNLDELTVDDLNPAVVKLLFITAPQTAYTSDEITVIANYVNAGGSLWMGGLADYNASLPWAATVADRENAILDAIETVTGQDVNMRMNDDEVIDGNTNNGYVFGVVWQDFPSAETTGIGMNVESVASWSLASIVDGDKQALTATDPGVQIVMQGDLDEGYTSDTWHNPFHTSNTDYDGMGDAYIYNPTWVYPASMPAGAIPLPAAAVVELSSGAGRIMLYGDSNDPFTIFAYTAGDGKQNELFNLQSVMWLLGEPLQKSTIAEARAQATPNQPDNLDQVVWVEGEITAAYGEFFNVLYVQDSTGGITVHAPAGDIDPSAFTRGTHVRAIGTLGIYNGDTEIEFFEAEMVQVIPPDAYDATPLALTTAEAALESNQGWLTTVTGRVISKSGTDTIVIDDGSGPVRIFLDGYNGTLADILLYDLVQVTGLASEDGNGSRIRVRNHNYHSGVDDDVIILGHAYRTVLPLIAK